MIASYNTLVRELANLGITLENESQKYLVMLTKGLEKRISELLPKTTLHLDSQHKIDMQQEVPFGEIDIHVKS